MNIGFTSEKGENSNFEEEQVRSLNRTEIIHRLDQLLNALNVPVNDPNFIETPRRVADYLIEHFNGNVYDESVEWEKIKKAVFPTEYPGILLETGIEVNGLCPHHMLNINYDISIAYIPKGHAIGLSKLARIADLIGKRPLMQEDVTFMLSEKLKEILNTENVGVIVRGVHNCMVVRGVRQKNSLTTTSVLSGVFLREDSARFELLTLLK